MSDFFAFEELFERYSQAMEQLTAELRWIQNLRANSGVAPRVEYTIAAGVITLVGYDKIKFITIDTEADAATDDLDTINGGVDGEILICVPAHAARTVVMKDGTGNLLLAGDFSLDNIADTIMLVYYGSAWVGLTPGTNNGA